MRSYLTISLQMARKGLRLRCRCLSVLLDRTYLNKEFAIEQPANTMSDAERWRMGTPVHERRGVTAREGRGINYVNSFLLLK